MADYNFKGYANQVIEEQIDSILATKLDVNKFMTPDYSLEAAPGMLLKVHKYTGSGTVDDLSRGDANSNFIDADYVEEVYQVARTQGQAKYYDDDAMADPKLVEAKIQYLAEGMANDWTRKAIAEFNKTENACEVSSYSLGSFADAIAQYTNVFESQEGLFFLCNIGLVPELRKMLGADLKYTEGYIKTGAIGDILGVPVYTSKAVPSGIIFLADKKAVRACLKKNTFVEQDRNIDKKENFIVAARYSVIALEDERRCIAIGAAQTTAVTLTTYTKNAKTIAGACTDGATVQAYVNGVATGTAATGSSGYSITATSNLLPGDVVKVVARLDGYVVSVATATVAA